MQQPAFSYSSSLWGCRNILQHRLLSLMWSPSSMTVADVFPSLSSPEQKTKSPTLLWFLLLFNNYSDPSTVTDPVNIQFYTMWTQMTLLNWLNVAVFYTWENILNTINPVNVYVTACSWCTQGSLHRLVLRTDKVQSCISVLIGDRDVWLCPCCMCGSEEAADRCDAPEVVMEAWAGGWGGRYMKGQLLCGNVNITWLNLFSWIHFGVFTDVLQIQPSLKASTSQASKPIPSEMSWQTCFKDVFLTGFIKRTVLVLPDCPLVVRGC